MYKELVAATATVLSDGCHVMCKHFLVKSDASKPSSFFLLVLVAELVRSMAGGFFTAALALLWGAREASMVACDLPVLSKMWKLFL